MNLTSVPVGPKANEAGEHEVKPLSSESLNVMETCIQKLSQMPLKKAFNALFEAKSAPIVSFTLMGGEAIMDLWIWAMPNTLESIMAVMNLLPRPVI